MASSSGPVQLWRIPSSVIVPPDGAPIPPNVNPQIPATVDPVTVPSWVVAVWLLIAGLFIVLIVIVVVSVRLGLPLPRFGRRSRWLPRQQIAALPEVEERDLTVDIDAAMAALTAGEARNAIVACWMQLESDAATVGLERLTAETPAEYVERVVGVSSIDPGPIKELAALYREARFSLHQLDDHDRSRAVAALERVAATLKFQHELAL